MKNFMRYLLAAGTLLSAMPIQANCPTLSSKELGDILFPISGLKGFTPPSADSMVYERHTDVSGAIKNLWAGARKKARDDGKKYSGVESDLKPGKLVCGYNLPAEWKKEAGITELKLTAEVNHPISKQLAKCPALKFSDVSNLMCKGKLEHSDMWSYPIHEKGAVEGVCRIFKGFVNKMSEAESTNSIHGHYDNAETKAFAHTCKYEYHIGSKPEELTIYGKMDLESLRGATAPRGGHGG
jgi:hypothetical protein